MFTKFVMKAGIKLISHPTMAAQMAPVVLVAGAAVAIYDLFNQ